MQGPQHSRACLLLHGFTGGPFELEPLTAALSEAGWQCRAPELPGHGMNASSLGQVRSTDWFQAAAAEAEELQRRFGSFDLIGFSMGGLLAVHVAARFKVRRVALLSTAAIYVSPGRFTREWWKRRRTKELSISRKIRKTPLSAIWEFMKTVRAARPDLSRVTAPTLIVQGLQDHIVHPDSASYLARRIGGPCTIRYLSGSRHLICLEDEREQVTRSVLQFFD